VRRRLIARKLRDRKGTVPNWAVGACLSCIVQPRYARANLKS
jgi:hypothetical protein